ncbi:hypothetical protein IOK49_03390 [Fervidicoccus fontis]|jgi:hypothetical protein|uniref:Uncharacterized protein n=2 Tax=Fervidicoccus fontis TaxID=683846 RepID=I0A0K2_FERFK|nr:hypothetical protein [Fervidicoccus fontis]AFH42509.1 hypothetical protein FFONT_0519 [Fervidicoccus fontis Kam940]MBE9391122.1 hypothetical protein [Fervidicoccus fontis]PMB75734.1 MAG: hypothetical protein C0188_01950 [Fervidicoccus fontis]PMB78120.1 MAG: hypothetical protein C0177_00920 [Fervidicoccus fontis]HEW64186.1 hypothetical protein [Fervidicoccus fontis]
MKAYRIFYTTFYDDDHENVKKKLNELIGIEALDHKSFVKEFRYLEYRSESLKPGLEEEIRRIAEEVLGKKSYIKVDFISL